VLIDSMGAQCYPQQMADGVAVSAFTADSMLLAIGRQSEKKVDLQTNAIAGKGRRSIEILLSQIKK